MIFLRKDEPEVTIAFSDSDLNKFDPEKITKTQFSASIQDLCKKLNIKPKRFKYGDGYKGLPEDSPFDGIIVTAGAPEIPNELLKQLKVGGRLVIPIGNKSQTMLRITKHSNTKYKKEKFGNFRFVPLLKNKN